MRSVTLVLPPVFRESPLLDYAQYWQKACPVDFTYLVKDGTAPKLLPVPDAVGTLSGASPIALKTVDSALKLNVKQVRYYEKAPLAPVMSNQSHFSDLLVMDKATFIGEYEALSEQSLMCPIFLPGHIPPIRRAMVLMDVTSIKLVLQLYPLLIHETEIILINCPECSGFEEDKGLVSYAQSHFKKVGVIHMNNATNPYPIPAIADDNTLLVANLSKYRQFRHILEQLLVMPQLQNLSYLINF